MGKEILTFGDIEIEKISFIVRHKTLTLLRDVDIEKVLVSNKISFGEKNMNTLLATYTIIIKLNHYI